VRADYLVLEHSPVLCVDGELAGLATVGLRGEQAYCKGFGIVVLYRGRGLAHQLCSEMLDQARRAGARCLTLGVLQRNERAVSTYLRAGLRVSRELLSFEWNSPSPRRGEGRGEGRSCKFNILLIEPTRAWQDFAALHLVAPTWERDLPTLRRLDDLNGLALVEGDTLRAYALFQQTGADAIELVDIAAAEARHAASLLCALQQRYAHITCCNEPADSPMIAAFRAGGFAETLSRYEMATGL
ncbi:MAG: GNAT family N-acetyltransferase, partial [Chloroflexi bacterium]|nr:GNAT family N-acetyltransferase [Chloroflexota bacterium]